MNRGLYGMEMVDREKLKLRLKVEPCEPGWIHAAANWVFWGAATVAFLILVGMGTRVVVGLMNVGWKLTGRMLGL